MKAGTSNPQQGFVCTDRAKVHLAGNYFWSSEFWNRADPNPARMGDSHYDRCPLAGAVSFALRNHAGKGVPRVNEGSPAAVAVGWARHKRGRQLRRPYLSNVSAVSRKRWRMPPALSATSSRHSGLSRRPSMMVRIRSLQTFEPHPKRQHRPREWRARRLNKSPGGFEMCNGRRLSPAADTAENES
jgi:hypothetical protein